MGTTEAELDGLRRADYALFPPAWRAALRYADAMTPVGAPVGAALFEELAAHWTQPQVVEITAVIALFSYFNRFALALDVPVTR